MLPDAAHAQVVRWKFTSRGADRRRHWQRESGLLDDLETGLEAYIAAAEADAQDGNSFVAVDLRDGSFFSNEGAAEDMEGAVVNDAAGHAHVVFRVEEGQNGVLFFCREGQEEVVAP